MRLPLLGPLDVGERGEATGLVSATVTDLAAPFALSRLRLTASARRLRLQSSSEPTLPLALACTLGTAEAGVDGPNCCPGDVGKGGGAGVDAASRRYC